MTFAHQESKTIYIRLIEKTLGDEFHDIISNVVSNWEFIHKKFVFAAKQTQKVNKTNTFVAPQIFHVPTDN